MPPSPVNSDISIVTVCNSQKVMWLMKPAIIISVVVNLTGIQFYERASKCNFFQSNLIKVMSWLNTYENYIFQYELITIFNYVHQAPQEICGSDPNRLTNNVYFLYYIWNAEIDSKEKKIVIMKYDIVKCDGNRNE